MDPSNDIWPHHPQLVFLFKDVKYYDHLLPLCLRAVVSRNSCLGPQFAVFAGKLQPQTIALDSLPCRDRLRDRSVDANVLYNAVATIRVVLAGHRGQFMAMNRAISVNRMRPIIDCVFSFDDVSAALRYFQEAQPFGEVVIRHRGWIVTEPSKRHAASR
jgi:hypothetical protein